MAPKGAAGPGEGESVELALPADPAAVRTAREVVRTTLMRWRVPQLVEVCALVVSELVTNAIRHGRPPVAVRLRRAGKRVQLLVLDHGGGASREPEALPGEELAESGRGLGIVRALADEVQAEQDGGTVVSASWHADRPPR